MVLGIAAAAFIALITVVVYAWHGGFGNATAPGNFRDTAAAAAPPAQSSREASPARFGESTDAIEDPFGWRLRLGRDWHEVIWPGYRGSGSIGFNRDLKALAITSDNCRIVELGQSLEKVSRISIGVNQPAWIGSVGLFCGYHKAEYEGRTCARFQYVELTITHPDDAQRKLLCRRSISVIDPANGQLCTVTRLGSSAVSYPSSPDPPRLELLLTNNNGNVRLARVFWQGKPVPEVVREAVEPQIQPEDWSGSWGIVSDCGTSWWYDPMVTP